MVNRSMFSTIKWWMALGIGGSIFAIGFYAGAMQAGEVDRNQRAFLVTVPEFKGSDGNTFIQAKVEVKSLTLALKAIGWFLQGRGTREILLEGNGAEVLARLINESGKGTFTIELYDEVRDNRSLLLAIKTSLGEDIRSPSLRTLDKADKRD